MAENQYTFAELKKAVKHATGKTVDGQLTDPGQLVNDALQKVVMAYPWTWRRKYDALDSGSSSNALSSVPSDFDGIYTLHVGAADGESYSFLNEVPPLRPGTSQNSHSKYRYHLETTAQTTASTLPTQTIYVFPKPPSSVSAAFDMIYLRVIPKLSADTDVPDMPAKFHILLKQAVRAHALSEDHNEPFASQEMERYQAMLDAFIKEDMAEQSNLSSTQGRAIGGDKAA